MPTHPKDIAVYNAWIEEYNTGSMINPQGVIEKDWPLFEELFGSSFQKQVSVHTRIPNSHL
jgi:hypothetical protein